MIFFLVSMFAFFRWRGTIFSSLPLVGPSIISYMTMVYMFTIGISRFHFPLVPLILGYVSALFYAMGRWISKGV